MSCNHKVGYPAVRAEVLRRHAAGESRAKLAVEFIVWENTIQRWIREERQNSFGAGLSSRAYNLLVRKNALTLDHVGALVKAGELSTMPGVGPKTAEEITRWYADQVAALGSKRHA